SIMQSTALLELKLVDFGPFLNQAAAAQQYGGMIPLNLEALVSRERGQTEDSYYVVQKVASVTGCDLKGAYLSRDENGWPAVSFNLIVDGAQKFGCLTEENIGKRLVIVLDGRVQLVSVINS